MRDKTNTPQSFVKMEEARRLMDQGYCQESLVLALEALLQELDILRDSLKALPMFTNSPLPVSTPATWEEPPHPEPCWLPPVKPRVLH
jgi:hypothetical protein